MTRQSSAAPVKKNQPCSRARRTGPGKPIVFLSRGITMKWRMKKMNAIQLPYQVYETTDLNLASFLRCRGFNIEDIKRENGRTTFIFNHTAELHHNILDFANDGPVGARSFCNTARDLKAITR
jgi:hypothetical protein